MNPILQASDWPYTVNAVFNPGVARFGGETLLLVRVEDRTGLSHLCVARSADGIVDWTIETDRQLLPEIESDPERFGIEDPRITLCGDEYMIVYTGYSSVGPLVCLASTRDFESFERRGTLMPPEERWAVVFSNDAHLPGDPELKVWGEHAMAGTAGAQVIAELEPLPGELELISPKRSYGAFDGTDLEERLRGLGVDEVVLAGQHTHICVRHSAYGALIRGYAITVPRDAVCAFAGVDEEDALEYLRTVYGARITSVAELLGRPVRVGVGPETQLGAGYDSREVLTHEP